MLRRVRGELGVAANPRPLQVHARIDGPVGERRLRLEMLGEGVRVERELRAGDCTELADAAVLLIAMALDPAGSEPQTELEPEPEPEPRAEPKPQPVLDPEPADVPVTPGWQPPPGPAWSVGAGLGVDGTSLPSVAVGPAVTGELRIWGRMRFGAQLRVWVPRPAAIEGTPSGQLRVLLPVVGLDACYDLLGPSLQTGPCVTSEVGALFARSEAIAQPASQWAPWAAVGAGWMLRIALGKSTQLRILGQLALPLTRDRLWVQTAAQPLVVHRPEPWSLRAGVGIAYTL